MSTWSHAALGIAICLLISCANDPMKPSRPFGRRVPVNTTPPPVTDSGMPAERPETSEPPGESNDG